MASAGRRRSRADPSRTSRSRGPCRPDTSGRPPSRRPPAVLSGCMMSWIIALPASTCLRAEKIDHDQVPTALPVMPALPFGFGAWIGVLQQFLVVLVEEGEDRGRVEDECGLAWTGRSCCCLLSSQTGESCGISLSFHHFCTRVRAFTVPSLLIAGLPSLSTSVPPSAQSRLVMFPSPSGVRPSVKPMPNSFGGC